MDHAVHYRTAAGETRLEEVGSIDAAVSMVERLRNDEGVSDVRVYRQVPIEFKTYYRVSVVEGGAGNASPSGSASAGSTPSGGAGAEPPAQPQAAAAPTPSAASAAPQSPPPGAMPLGPSTPSQPSAQPSAQPAAASSSSEDEGDTTKKGSLFSRG